MKEYCYKAVLNDEYIIYIAYDKGIYDVRVTNETRTKDYVIYRNYEKFGNACNRLLESARNYKSNTISYYYMKKEMFLRKGAF